MARQMAECKPDRKNDMFIAAVEYLAVKYQIGDYAVVTKEGYHVTADSYAELEVKKELVKLLQK